MKVRMKQTKELESVSIVFTVFSDDPSSAWSSHPVQMFQSPWKWGWIKRVALIHLRTGLALGNDEKGIHLLPSLPCCPCQKLPLCVIYRGRVGLQACFFSLFSLATTPHNCTQAFCWGSSGGSKMKDFCVLCHLMTTGSDWNEACQETTTKRNQ